MAITTTTTMQNTLEIVCLTNAQKWNVKKIILNSPSEPKKDSFWSIFGPRCYEYKIYNTYEFRSRPARVLFVYSHNWRIWTTHTNTHKHTHHMWHCVDEQPAGSLGKWSKYLIDADRISCVFVFFLERFGNIPLQNNGQILTGFNKYWIDLCPYSLYSCTYVHQNCDDYRRDGILTSSNTIVVSFVQQLL